jgi:hypothetical protein
VQKIKIKCSHLLFFSHTNQQGNSTHWKFLRAFHQTGTSAMATVETKKSVKVQVGKQYLVMLPENYTILSSLVTSSSSSSSNAKADATTNVDLQDDLTKLFDQGQIEPCTHLIWTADEVSQADLGLLIRSAEKNTPSTYFLGNSKHRLEADQLDLIHCPASQSSLAFSVSKNKVTGFSSSIFVSVDRFEELESRLSSLGNFKRIAEKPRKPQQSKEKTSGKEKKEIERSAGRQDSNKEPVGQVSETISAEPSSTIGDSTPNLKAQQAFATSTSSNPISVAVVSETRTNSDSKRVHVTSNMPNASAVAQKAQPIARNGAAADKQKQRVSIHSQAIAEPIGSLLVHTATDAAAASAATLPTTALFQSSLVTAVDTSTRESAPDTNTLATSKSANTGESKNVDEKRIKPSALRNDDLHSAVSYRSLFEILSDVTALDTILLFCITAVAFAFLHLSTKS